MIIDCHGHYTTDRSRTTSGARLRSRRTKRTNRRPVPAISDGEIQESIEANQLRILRERGADMTIFSPRASAMEHHVGDEAVSQHWSRACNDLIKRVVDLYPDAFIGVGQLPQSPGADWKDRLPNSIAASTISASSAVISVRSERGKWSGRPSPTATGTRSTRKWSNSTYPP